MKNAPFHLHSKNMHLSRLIQEQAPIRKSASGDALRISPMLTETADPMISVCKNGGTSRVGVGGACAGGVEQGWRARGGVDRKSTRLNSSHPV